MTGRKEKTKGYRIIYHALSPKKCCIIIQVMGILKLYNEGNIHSMSLKSYKDANSKYHKWWDSYVSGWISEHVLEIVRLKVADEAICDEIREFRKRFDLFLRDEITQTDIIRFHSLKVIKWLYGDFKDRFLPLLGHIDMVSTITMIEMSITTALDAICYIEDISHSIYKYNQYVQHLLYSFTAKLGTFSKLTFVLKKKYFAVLFIQRQWRETISNPNYLLCKKRLIREFNEMI